MTTGLPNASFTSAFDTTGKQADAYSGLSPTGEYVAFLSKADEDLSNDPNGWWWLFFEMIPAEWYAIAYASGVCTSSAPPSVMLPTYAFQVLPLVEADVLSILNLSSIDWLIEGSWFTLNILETVEPARYSGLLYDPNVDFSEKALEYGWHAIGGGTLLEIPQMSANGLSLQMVLPPAQAFRSAPPVNPRKRKASGDLGAMSTSAAKRAAITPIAPQAGPPPPLPSPPLPSPPPPPAGCGVGIMDIGQGNCNLLIVNNAPVAYYDVGYPLYFFFSSVPAAMDMRRQQAAPPYGPIPGMPVVLSHWDWDHWRLGLAAQMTGVAWTFPQQPRSPTAQNFLLALGHANQNEIPQGTGPQAGPGGCTIFTCAPGNLPQQAIINNSGLAVAFAASNLPVYQGDQAEHMILLTGDANFGSVNNLNGQYLADLSGVVVVHHGSSTNNTTVGIPPPVQLNGNQNGRLAYSYGLTYPNVNPPRYPHAYGFPTAAAVTAYTNAGWGTQPNALQSTAEGANINANYGQGQVPARGNVRMGTATALPQQYNNYAFFAVAFQLQ